jgi:F-type H+-transporting ATPase subunit epsilon
VPEPKSATPAVEVLRCRILTPEAAVFEQDVTRVEVTGVAGTMEILPRHEAFLSPLAMGTASAYLPGNPNPVFFAILGGFLDMDGVEATILADAAERADHINVGRAREALDRAKDRLTEAANLGTDVSKMDVDRAKLAMIRALTRIRATEDAVKPLTQ